MKRSELFIMMAAAERDLASMSRARPDMSTTQRADPRFVEATAGARAALFMELANLALQAEELEARLRAGETLDLKAMRPYRREDLVQLWPPAPEPEPEKPKRPWPTCRQCGEDLILAHVDRGFCNADCEAKARAGQ